MVWKKWSGFEELVIFASWEREGAWAKGKVRFVRFGGLGSREAQFEGF